MLGDPPIKPGMIEVKWTRELIEVMQHGDLTATHVINDCIRPYRQLHVTALVATKLCVQDWTWWDLTDANILVMRIEGTKKIPDLEGQAVEFFGEQFVCAHKFIVQIF